ncbi:MAG: sulfurase [Paracoccaceae bacterium]
MPELIDSGLVARIVWLGRTEQSATPLAARPQERLELDLGGVRGDVHYGATRPSCVRVRNLHPVETEIRNTRQLTLLAEEDVQAIAATLGLSQLDPRHLGANVVMSGLADFSFLPPGARLRAEDGAVLAVDRINLPCNIPARAIETAEPGHGKAFKAAAQGRRGVTAWVERGGVLGLGQTLALFLPNQRAWRGQPA